jgi:hypothetical protein
VSRIVAESDLERELAADADLLRGLAWGRGRFGHPWGCGLHVASILARIGGYARMREYRARQAHESEGSSPSYNVSSALRSVQRVLEEPEDDAEHCVADRRLAEGSAVGGELR